MTKILRLTLLGSPQVLLGDQPVTAFATYKAQALLFYLAVSGQPHSRDSLATLLWEGMTDAQAKKNLRTVLPDLRTLLGDHLQIDRQTVAFRTDSPYWLDVESLRGALTPGQPSVDRATRQAAVDLYRGDFLAGFHIQNAPAFDSWVLEQREQLHLLVVTALGRLVTDYSQAGEYPPSLAANRRLLAMEPWSEPVHRQQMSLLAQTGERAAALAQYESCRRILQAEFGVEPLAETTTLYEQIRAGEIGRQSSPSHEPPTAVIGQRQQVRAPLEHNLPQSTRLHGRQEELSRLQQWIVADGCRLVGIFGIGGQGKSALAATFVRTLAESLPKRCDGFQQIIWTSLLNAPPLAEVLQEWLYQLSDQQVIGQPASLDQQLTQLLDFLRARRTLLVLDNLESILHGDARSGYYRPGYEVYGQLLHRLAESQHASCLLITSREWPREMLRLEEERPSVRSLALAGLSADAGQRMMTHRGVIGDAASLAAFVQHYSGNPLALNLAAETVRDFFDGNISAFLQADTLIFDDIRDVLDQQFTRLTPLEREILGWLAVVREPIPYASLSGLLAQPPAPRAVMEAMRSLQRRSLLEKFDDAFGLQNVVLEYTTAWLVDGILRELLDDTPVPFGFLNRYALILAQTKEYVRASQHRLLLQPVAEGLLAQRGRQAAAVLLRAFLNRLRDCSPLPGYAGANLLHLLLALEIDLSGYDFSHLFLRQLYLRGVSLPDTNFAYAEIIDSAFTEPFGLVYSVVFSLDGRYLAAGTGEGAVYIWRTADQQLVQVIQAHSQSISEVAFGERVTATGERQSVLVSVGEDKDIGLSLLTPEGVLERFTCLHHDEQPSLLAVGISPNGCQVTGVGEDGQVFVWEMAAVQSPRLLHRVMTHPTRLRLVAFDADGKTVAVGNRDGRVAVCQLATGETSLALNVPTDSLVALALDKTGQRLATGENGGKICLWSLPAGELLGMTETESGVVDALAFSPDGRFLTSSHGDRAVRVWAVEENCTSDCQSDVQGLLPEQFGPRLLHTLLGHSHVVWSVVFAPQSAGSRERLLVASSSSDQTVRVWDAETGHALYTLRGQPRALGSLAIAPRPNDSQESAIAQRVSAGWLLAAVGYDQLVHLWQGEGRDAEATRRTLRGQSCPLYTVAISPDSRALASAGRDRSIDLWDVASGELRQSLQGHTNSITCLAFHPAGKVMASGSTDGTARLWAMHPTEHSPAERKDAALASQPVVVLEANSRYVYDIAFHPAGHTLAAVGADPHLRLWDMTQSPPVERVEARRSVSEAGEQDIFCVAFSPDGSRLACGGNALIYLWQGDAPPLVLRQGDAPPLVLRQHTAWIFSLAFSPDGTLLVSSGADATVCLWDAESGRLRAVLRGHKETIYKAGFTPDGQFVVSCSFDGTVKFWDVATEACVNSLAVEGPCAGMRIDGTSGITQAQRRALRALGAVEEGEPDHSNGHDSPLVSGKG